ncbi:hypothetical protein Tco_1109241 [Tanacetum coccineum]
MSTQQDIYVAGSENRPPMLNKENYVPWSSRLLRYAKSRPNGKLIYNSIINGPYVRRMIPKLGDQNREVPVNETFHEQTDDELTEKELKQVEADDQAIQTILLGLPEDIYDAVDSCGYIAQPDMNMGQDKQMQMAGCNGGNQFRQYAGQNVGNQNGYNAVQNVRNPNLNRNGNVVAARAKGNVIRNNGNQIRCYNCRGLSHLARNCTVKPRRRDVAYLHTQLLIAQKEEAGIQLQAEEFDLMAAAADLDEIEEVNANCILMANLQQASTSGTQTNKAPLYDSDGSAENDSNVISEVSSVEQDGGTVDQHLATIEETRAYFELLYNNLAIEVEKVNLVNHKMKETNADLTTELARYKNQEKCFEISQEKYDKLERAAKFVREFKSLVKETDESLAKHKDLELEIERLLRAVVSQDVMSIVQSNSVIDTSNLQTELDRTKERSENCIIKNENEYAKLWNDWHKKSQLGDQKGKSKDTPCVSNTLDPLSQKLENENVELEFHLRAQLLDKVSEQKDTTKGMSVNTQFCKQLILGKPPSSSKPKLYDVTLFPNSKGFPKINETHALSKPVTSNSVPTPQESKVMKNDNVIAPGMFRINPFKPSSKEKYIPNKVRARVRTNLITVSQPHVITKKDVNSDSNGLSSTRVDNTAKTRRPQPRSNTKNDRVPFVSKSSCSKNKEVEVEEHPRNLLRSKNKKHMSS